MQQRFHVQKERKLPLLSDKRGRERERGKGGFARSALLFSLLSFSVPGVVAAFAIFVSYPRSIYKCQAFACTCSTLYDLCIPIVRERERELRRRSVEASCLSVASGQVHTWLPRKEKNNNLTSIPFETPILRVQFLIVRIKSRDEIDLSSSSEEVHSLREDTSVELILYNINRHVRACCSQIFATLNTRFFFFFGCKKRSR